jgi:hypothetical protein
LSFLKTLPMAANDALFKTIIDITTKGEHNAAIAALG